MNAFMTAADMRSPFKSLPNTGTRPGYAPSQVRFITCMVVKVHVDPNGTPNFLFDVRAITDGATSGGDDNNITEVPMMQAGFGSLTDVGRSPAGIVYVPEVGSLVLCIYTGSRWYISGFFTGPSIGALTQLLDKEGRLVTFNPGIEYGLNRLIAPAKYDIPWLYGLDQGDIILGKDLSRIKVCDRGVFLSGGATASLILLKTDGERLDRYSSYESRGVGVWERHNFTRGDEQAASQNATDPTLANPPAGGSAYHCEIMETSPYMVEKAPYLVFERGHISRAFEPRGRSAIYASSTAQVIKTEKQNKDYAVMRMFIAQPVEEQPSPSEETVSERTTAAQAVELNKAAYEQFDLQLDVDGSWRLRAGNSSKAPKGQGVAPTKEMDYSLEYDALDLSWLMRIGKAGSDKTSVFADSFEIMIHTPNLIGKIDATVQVVAKKSITLTTKEMTINANSFKINKGPVDIEKELTVEKTIFANDKVEVLKDVNSGGKVTSRRQMVSPRYKKAPGSLPEASDGPGEQPNTVAAPLPAQCLSATG